MNRLVSFFVIPAEMKPEFARVSAQRNRISLQLICVMIFGMELFNMARVLFWSQSGLGTLNNRIYFGLYCALFVMALLYMILSALLRGRPLSTELKLQYAGVALCLVWHVCMNAYDLSRDPGAGAGIYSTAALGMGAFILMPAQLALLLHAMGFALFMLLGGAGLESGDLINLSFTAIVALAISLASSRQHVIMISQGMEISRMNERLQVLVQRDALTGLLNKRAFERSVEPHLAAEGAALLRLDLDNFKAINDLHGHPCGDYVLQETARCLEEAIPGALAVGRIGGDEFAALMPAGDAAGQEEAARGLTASVAAISWRGRPLGTGCSAGICRIGAAGADYGRLYGETDRALYRAKEQGKGGVCITQLL